MIIGIVPDPSRPECCTAAELLGSGLMTNLGQAWGKKDGDCHEIAAAIMLDIATLQSQGAPIGTWVWYMGRCPRIGSHSWIETDGWAIDASNGADDRPIIVQESQAFRRSNGAKKIKEKMQLVAKR